MSLGNYNVIFFILMRFSNFKVLNKRKYNITPFFLCKFCTKYLFLMSFFFVMFFDKRGIKFFFYDSL